MISESDKTDNEYEIAFDYGVTKVFLHKIANHPNKIRKWFADESWSPEQAVCLFYDIDPYEYEKIKNHPSIINLLGIAEKYQSQSPQEWKEFAIKNQIPIPTAFNSIPIVESASNQASQLPEKSNNKIEREFTTWLREIWVEEGKPNGTKLFNALKKHTNMGNSPIREHYTTGRDGAGIRYQTGSATRDMTKKTIQNKVANFKNENTVNSKKP